MTDPGSSDLASALGAIVSQQCVLTDSAACATYAVQGSVPGCVVAPGSLEELSAVMRVAQEHRAATVPWGGGTHQRIGNPPAVVDLVVRMERLNRVLIHEPADLTISVEAGITIAALRRHLAPHGQMLPLDPPLPDRATIGGLIATAADGARRLGYGTLRNLLIGVGVVEAGGRISKAGGMVVKNVSGFDMMKLYLGSFGTLATIASANFKLLPAPRAAATALCVFAGREAAFAALAAIEITQLTPTAAEYLDQRALQAIGLEGQCALALRAEGLPAAVRRHVADMTDLARHNGASRIDTLDGATEAELWAGIADLPQVADLAEDEALIKLSTLPIETERALGRIEELAARHGCAATASARALNGVIYARLRPVDGAALRAIVAALPGVQWVATTLNDVPRWGPPPSGLDLMRRIKAEFDPLGLLNAGRFVEGM
jgi:glycolate oxidase FAD binding subunit